MLGKAIITSFVVFLIAINCVYCQNDYTVSVLFGNLQQYYPGFNADQSTCNTTSNVTILDCFGGAAKMATLAKEIKAKNPQNTIFISEGGNFLDIKDGSQPKWWGNFWANDNYTEESRFVGKVTNQMGYDYVLISDDDLDDLYSNNSKINDLMSNSDAQNQNFITGCNIEVNGGTDNNRNGRADIYRRKVNSNATEKEINGAKVRIVSYVSGNGAHDGDAVVKNNDFNDICNDQINKTKYNVTILIGVFWSTIAKAKEIAKNKNFDLIIVSSTEHTQDVRSEKLNNTLLVYSPPYGRELQRVNISVINGTVEAKLIETYKLDKSIKDDDVIRKAINDWHEKWKYYENKAIGNSWTKMDPSSCQTKECTFGNLLTDAMFYSYFSDSKTKDNKTQPIVAVPANEFWTPLNSASHANHPITFAELFFAIHYRNVSYAFMNGTQVRRLFENAVSKYEGKTGSPNFLQVSGAKIEYNLNKKQCERIKSFQVKTCKVVNCSNYEEISENKTYAVMNYEVLKSLPNNCNSNTSNLDAMGQSNYFDDLIVYANSNNSAFNVTEESRLRNSANQLSTYIPAVMIALFSILTAIVNRV